MVQDDDDDGSQIRETREVMSTSEEQRAEGEVLTKCNRKECALSLFAINPRRRGKTSGRRCHGSEQPRSVYVSRERTAHSAIEFEIRAAKKKVTWRSQAFHCVTTVTSVRKKGSRSTELMIISCTLMPLVTTAPAPPKHVIILPRIPF